MMHKRSWTSPAGLVFVSLAGVLPFFAAKASANTSQFRGVNWADQRDNFQSGVLYVSGLSSSDTYSSAFATGTSVMSELMSKLGANAVRLPINEATVSQYWGTYTGAIDAVLAKGMVVFCYWDSAKSNKPPDMNAFWNMWKTVVDKYGGYDNAYFEVFNEPNMYSKADLVALYTSWLTRFSTLPRGRVILDGTGNAQNVPDIGSASELDGCLLAVHDYSFFGSDTWTSESQWTSHLRGEVGNYADRTICTEWGGPMSPGSKNGISYDYLDYGKSPTNYFEAYIRGMSSQLRAWNMGSFYWPGLRDGDWYSMTIRSGTGSNLVLSIPNQSGLAQLQNAWTGPPPSADAGAGGSGGLGGSDAGAGGATAAGTGGGTGMGGATSGGRGGVTGTSTPSGGGGTGMGGTTSGGRGGVTGTSAPSGGGSSGMGQGGASGTSDISGGAGGAGGGGGTYPGSGGAAGGMAEGGAPGSGGAPGAAGGTTAAAGGSSGYGGSGGTGSGGAGDGGHGSAGTATAAGGKTSGCSCEIGRAGDGSLGRLPLLLGLLGLSGLGRLRRRAPSKRGSTRGTSA
jgi:hypothetical protein